MHVLSMEKYATIAEASYIETALWSEMDWPSDDESEPTQSLSEAGYSASSISVPAQIEIAEDVSAFVRVAWHILSDVKPSDCGRLLWLTRNGHGTGFWDHDGIAHGSTLTIIARTMGERNLYIGDNGRVHV
jgi:hypothetical protein